MKPEEINVHVWRGFVSHQMFVRLLSCPYRVLIIFSSRTNDPVCFSGWWHSFDLTTTSVTLLMGKRQQMITAASSSFASQGWSTCSARCAMQWGGYYAVWNGMYLKILPQSVTHFCGLQFQRWFTWQQLTDLNSKGQRQTEDKRTSEDASQKEKLPVFPILL